jgi:hypothetical protein
VTKSRRQDLRSLSTEELIALWRERVKQVLDVFGPETLLPSLICGMVWSDLESFLHQNFWDEDADSLLRRIASGGKPDPTVLANAELFQVAEGKLSLDAWLTAHGHRGPANSDLASPRWREQPERLREMAARLMLPESRHWSGSNAAASLPCAKPPTPRAAATAEAREFDRL